MAEMHLNHSWRDSQDRPKEHNVTTTVPYFPFKRHNYRLGQLVKLNRRIGRIAWLTDYEVTVIAPDCIPNGEVARWSAEVRVEEIRPVEFKEPVATQGRMDFECGQARIQHPLDRTADELGVNISDSSTYGDLARIRLLKPPTAHGGEPIPARLTGEDKREWYEISKSARKLGISYETRLLMEAEFFTDRFEANHDADLDEREKDPRWETNREVRFAPTAVGTAREDMTTYLTGIEREPERPEVESTKLCQVHGVTVLTFSPAKPDLPIRSWRSVAERSPAAFWAYLQATAISTRKRRVYRLLVDRANCTIIAQRRHFALPVGNHSIGYVPDAQRSVPVKGFKTLHREGVESVNEALELANKWAESKRRSGHIAEVITMAGSERKLIILTPHQDVILRPDRKNAPEIRREHYTSAADAAKAFNNIRQWAKAQNTDYRFWDQTQKRAERKVTA